MEDTIIIFLDDDGEIKKRDVELKEKTVSYVTFYYKGKLTSLPWHRILKIKEVYDEQ